MAADAAPDDMEFASEFGWAVGEGSPSVVGPCHLEDARVTLNGLYAQAGPEIGVRAQVVDHLRDGLGEQLPFGCCQGLVFSQEL